MITLDSTIHFASAIIHNLENSKGELIVFIHTFNLSVLHFWCSNITYIIYFLLRKNILTYSFRSGLLATNSFHFPSPENVLISPLLMKYIFSRYRNISLQFSFITWECFVAFFWATWFLKSNPLSFKLFFPYRWLVILFWLLSKLLSSFLVFRSFILIYLDVNFFRFTCVLFIQLLESVGLYLGQIWRFFRSPLFLCSF